MYNELFYFDIDTIPGRQCMASCFFLLKQFVDVLVYLNSIKVRVTRGHWLEMRIVPVVFKRSLFYPTKCERRERRIRERGVTKEEEVKRVVWAGNHRFHANHLPISDRQFL